MDEVKDFIQKADKNQEQYEQKLREDHLKQSCFFHPNMT